MTEKDMSNPYNWNDETLRATKKMVGVLTRKGSELGSITLSTTETVMKDGKAVQIVRSHTIDEQAAKQISKNITAELKRRKTT
jgi:hypothetical protein